VPGAIAFGEWLAGTFIHQHSPDIVVQIGDRITSKRLQGVAASRPAGVALVVVHPSGERLDPSHAVTYRVQADAAAFCRAVAEVVPPADPEWLADWREADRRIDSALATALTHSDVLDEPRVAHLVSLLAPAGSGLFLASSMPVRDMDRFASSHGARLRVASNRGASGIDGTLASAVGFAIGLAAPVTLVIGDLALLHDLNALALLRERRWPVVVVAINNRGGGIFSFLPISTFPHVFERYFAAPHTVSFAHAAALFDVHYARPANVASFESAYRAAFEHGKSTLIEVCTDREENVRVHRRLSNLIDGLWAD
jgi:2-succinyl-5-enolpyruvyl-6-hydroxy-3-cyclohexene-1-carboxylate synthase